MIFRLKREIKKLQKEMSRLETQLAGCSVAALGWEGDIDKSCYGWSPSYQDVRDLRKFADLEREFLEQKGLWEEFKKFKEDKEAEICSG